MYTLVTLFCITVNRSAPLYVTQHHVAWRDFALQHITVYQIIVRHIPLPMSIRTCISLHHLVVYFQA